VAAPVGDKLAEPVFRSFAWCGRYVVVGFAGGAIPTMPWNLALLKGARIVGVFWGDFLKRVPKAERIHKAYARKAGRQVKGKILLVNPRGRWEPHAGRPWRGASIRTAPEGVKGGPLCL
jgi:NADPH:quinone reductase-like Zn-dependent oxidoreductase